jgi:hypothetical protein
VSIYDRVLGVEKPRIPVHQFQAILAEFARGRLTGAQAQAAVEQISGEPLDQAEVAEAQTLLATFTGSATAKLARAKEVDDVLLLASMLVQYDTSASLKARLGV